MEAGRPGRDLIASHLGQLFMVCVLCRFCFEFSDVRRVSSTVGFVFCVAFVSSFPMSVVCLVQLVLCSVLLLFRVSRCPSCV